MTFCEKDNSLQIKSLQPNLKFSLFVPEPLVTVILRFTGHLQDKKSVVG